MKDELRLLIESQVQPFQQWLTELATEDPPPTLAGDFSTQGTKNLLTFSVGDENGTYDVEVVERFIRGTATLWQHQLRETHPESPLLFYAWHDWQAGQFRCSVIGTTEVRDLPFGCTVETTSELRPILEAGASDQGSHDWENFSIVDEGDEDTPFDPKSFVLSVFVLRL